MEHCGAIKSSWIELAPGHRMDPHFWLGVVGQLKKLGIDPNEATRDQVKTAICNLETFVQEKNQEAQELRRQAEELLKRARSLEQESEDSGGKPRLRK